MDRYEIKSKIFVVQRKIDRLIASGREGGKAYQKYVNILDYLYKQLATVGDEEE